MDTAQTSYANSLRPPPDSTISGIEISHLRTSLLSLCFYTVYSRENLDQHLAKTFVEGTDDLVSNLIALEYFDAVRGGYRLSETGYTFMVTPIKQRAA